MTKIIDKRLLPKNQISGSRQKFIDRYKQSIKNKIKDILKDSTIKDLKKANKKVKIKAGDLDEPEFQFEHGTGNSDRVYIGNKTFQRGQQIKRDSGGGGKGRQASNDGGGEDDFEFVLTEKEFSDLLFEDLELPDLIKREINGTNHEIQHAGYSRNGGPSSLNVRKTMANSIGRRIAIKNKCEYCKDGLVRLEGNLHQLGMSTVKCKGKKIQYIEDLDLRYNFKDKVDVPTTKAVMMCLMDVSGSMDETMKDMAKRFFILLNLFLKKNYLTVDVVFVRHAENAEECTEDEFFHNRATGGTIISAGYDKLLEIIKDRYDPENWNIYVAQASDGDNWSSDNEEMENKLVRYILPQTQYFAYINIMSNYFRAVAESSDSEVMTIMRRLMGSHANLQAREVTEYRDIFPVFRSLFKKGA